MQTYRINTQTFHAPVSQRTRCSYQRSHDQLTSCPLNTDFFHGERDRWSVGSWRSIHSDLHQAPWIVRKVWFRGVRGKLVMKLMIFYDPYDAVQDVFVTSDLSEQTFNLCYSTFRGFPQDSSLRCLCGLFPTSRMHLA